MKNFLVLWLLVYLISVPRETFGVFPEDPYVCATFLQQLNQDGTDSQSATSNDAWTRWQAQYKAYREAHRNDTSDFVPGLLWGGSISIRSTGEIVPLSVDCEYEVTNQQGKSITGTLVSYSDVFPRDRVSAGPQNLVFRARRATHSINSGEIAHIRKISGR